MTRVLNSEPRRGGGGGGGGVWVEADGRKKSCFFDRTDAEDASSAREPTLRITYGQQGPCQVSGARALSRSRLRADVTMRPSITATDRLAQLRIEFPAFA